MVRFGVEKPEKTGFTKNLSATGIFIRTNNVMKPGTTLQVQVELPEGSVEALFGANDTQLRRIEGSFDVRLSGRGSTVRVAGAAEPASVVEHLLVELGELVGQGHRPSATDVETAIRVLGENPTASLVEFFLEDAAPAPERPVRAGRDEERVRSGESRR